MGSSLDQIGPFARTVADAELVFDTMKGHDRMDATTLPDYAPVMAKNKTIGLPRAFVTQASSRAQEAFEKSLDLLRGKGYEIVDIDFPSAPYALPAYYIVMPAEVSTNLARLDGVRYGLHVDGEKLLDDYKPVARRGLRPGDETSRDLGDVRLSSGYYDAYYTKATALRSALANDLTTRI